MPTKTPHTGSVGEEEFALHLRAHKIHYDREVQFFPGRRWRFDFVITGTLIAVEIDGGTWNGGRHSRGAGYTADCEKLNTAVKLGFRVFRYTPAMVSSGTAINDILEILGARQ